MKDDRYLFVCSANYCRSRTGEDVFHRLGFEHVRSAGTMVGETTFACGGCGDLTIKSGQEVCHLCDEHTMIDSVQLDGLLLGWADVIMLMDVEHFMWLVRNVKKLGVHIFGENSKKRIEVLGIPDDYGRGDPTLVKIFEEWAASESTRLVEDKKGPRP